MRNLKLGLAPVLVLVLACGLSGIAQADSVYLIVADDDSGVFAGTPSYDEDYTIINYASIIGGMYPWPLEMAVAAEIGTFGFDPGTEFFFVGTMMDQFEEDHLLMGAPGLAGTMILPFVNNVIEDINTDQKGEGEGTRFSPFPSAFGGSSTTDSETFWDWFDTGEGFNASNFVDILGRGNPESFVPFNVISNLSDGEGVENIFGFCFSVVQNVTGDENGSLKWLWDDDTQEINTDGSAGLWKPIPEPGSLTLMLGGLLIAGALWRRKRST